MSQSLAQIYLHIIFSTKNRYPFLHTEDIRKNLHHYLTGACRNLNCPSIIIGGTADHVHILTRYSRQITISDFIREIKMQSSKWIKKIAPDLQDFFWQSGYGIFSVSPSHVENLKPYIYNQEKHHRKESFKDEFRRICKNYSVEIDERYVWN